MKELNSTMFFGCFLPQKNTPGKADEIISKSEIVSREVEDNSSRKT